MLDTMTMAKAKAAALIKLQGRIFIGSLPLLILPHYHAMRLSITDPIPPRFWVVASDISRAAAANLIDK
jgi:hypothetical protein